MQTTYIPVPAHVLSIDMKRLPSDAYKIYLVTVVSTVSYGQPSHISKEEIIELTALPGDTVDECLSYLLNKGYIIAVKDRYKANPSPTRRNDSSESLQDEYLKVRLESIHKKGEYNVSVRRRDLQPDEVELHVQLNKMAVWMYRKIRTRPHFHRSILKGRLSSWNKDLSGCLKDFDLTIKQLFLIIQFVIHDEFWSEKIHSPSGLRRNLDSIQADIRSKSNRKKKEDEGRANGQAYQEYTGP